MPLTVQTRARSGEWLGPAARSLGDRWVERTVGVVVVTGALVLACFR